MSKEIDGKKVETVFRHIGYILICGSLMGGGAAIAKYSEKISSSLPAASLVSGLIIAFIGLGLTAYAGVYGMQEISKYYNSKIKGVVYGLFYLYMSSQLAMALFFAATSS